MLQCILYVRAHLMPKHLLTVSFIALTLIIGAGLYFSFVDPYASRVIQARITDVFGKASMPEELKDAAYLLTAQNGGGMYSYADKTLSFADYERNGSIVVDVAVFGGMTAKLLHNPVTDTHDVLVGDAILLSSALVKKFLFASKDGSRISVAVKDPEGAVTDPASWNVVIIDRASGAFWGVPAFGAVFLDPDTVLAFRADGVVAVDYETGEEVKYLDSPIILTHHAIAQSEDRTKIAWTTHDAEAFVYELSDSEHYPIRKIDAFFGVLGGIALSNEHLYELRRTKSGGTDVIQYTLRGDGSSRIVRSVPPILAIKKLIP